jgi:outer membrane protein OmpA-like peptidoglycan-associated protein
MIKNHGFRKKWKWMKFSASYTAKGGETVLILGHFNHSKVKRFKGWAHYYVDDVSVTLVKTENELPEFVAEKKTQKAAEVFPKLNEIITLQNIFFNPNESELLPISFLELDQLVSLLNQVSETKIEISGHTDNTGDEQHNKVLSELRAKAVADYLIDNKIASNRIVYKGYGSAKPLASNSNEAGKQQNRRVDFLLLNMK